MPWSQLLVTRRQSTAVGQQADAGSGAVERPEAFPRGTAEYRLLALEDEQVAGLVLGPVAERGQRCFDPGEARFDELLAHVLEGRDGTQFQLLEVLGQVRRTKPGDLITRDEGPPGPGEVTRHLFLGPELRLVDFLPFGHDAEPPEIRHPVGEVRLHEELAAWLDNPAQLVSPALAIDDVVPDEEQQGCVTRGIWQRDLLGRPSRIGDGGMASMGNGLSTHLVRRLDPVGGAAEGTRQRGGHAAGTRAEVEPEQWPCLGQMAGRRRPPGL